MPNPKLLKQAAAVQRAERIMRKIECDYAAGSDAFKEAPSGGIWAAGGGSGQHGSLKPYCGLL